MSRVKLALNYAMARIENRGAQATQNSLTLVNVFLITLTIMLKILILIDYSSEFSRRIAQRADPIFQGTRSLDLLLAIPSYYKTLYGKEGIVGGAKEWEARRYCVTWDH
jgi:hypothetical protein